MLCDRKGPNLISVGIYMQGKHKLRVEEREGKELQNKQKAQLCHELIPTTAFRLGHPVPKLLWEKRGRNGNPPSFISLLLHSSTTRCGAKICARTGAEAGEHMEMAFQAEASSNCYLGNGVQRYQMCFLKYSYCLFNFFIMQL